MESKRGKNHLASHFNVKMFLIYPIADHHRHHRKLRIIMSQIPPTNSGSRLLAPASPSSSRSKTMRMPFKVLIGWIFMTFHSFSIARVCRFRVISLARAPSRRRHVVKCANTWTCLVASCCVFVVVFRIWCDDFEHDIDAALAGYSINN